MVRIKRSLVVVTSLLLVSFVPAGSLSAECMADYSLSTIITRCPCVGGMITLGQCQRFQGGGLGCDPGGTTVICGGGACQVIAAAGCISGGPKMVLPLSSSLRQPLVPLFREAPKVAVMTCYNDTRAFERWLMETSSARRVQPLKIGD